MDLVPGEELIWAGKPSWRSMVSLYLSGAVIGLVPLLFIILARSLFDADWSIFLGVVIFVVVLAATIVFGWARRYFTQYTITNRRIGIRTGILAKREETAHIDRLQNVTITQTLFDRIFQVGALDFDTAGVEGELRFAGINDPQQLRDRISREHLSTVEPGLGT